jgi:phospholipase C
MHAFEQRLTRRGFLRAGAGAAVLGALSPALGRWWTPAGAAALRQPDSLPDPSRPAGTPDGRIPIDHVVILMMENHSFDNYLGMLPHRGQPLADGFRVLPDGRPAHTNPVNGGRVRAFHLDNECQPPDAGNSWTPTHKQVNGGAMDGFARLAPSSMGYWDEPDLPFYYSLARTFTLANRWFCSAPAQTEPNRRYLMAATSSGTVGDPIGLTNVEPVNGTIFDRLSHYGISWADYFVELPQIAYMPMQAENHAANLRSVVQFYVDAAAGTLPAVSFVDPEINAPHEIVSQIHSRLHLTVPPLSQINGLGASEEGPDNIQFGESFAASIVNAVVNSPAWPRTMLIWFYDEHGGWYDHVPPVAVPTPDNIAPMLSPTDVKGAFDISGCRVPAVVVSPWSRPNAVSNVAHEHTSVLAFIEQKWNLPAITRRDANAPSMLDFLDFSRPRMLEPPTLAAAANPLLSEPSCSNDPPAIVVEAESVARPVTPTAPTRVLPVTGFDGRAATAGAAAALAALTVRGLVRAAAGQEVEGVGQHIDHCG